jgi:CubicO group peptidase (beta-lactamase class C family)
MSYRRKLPAVLLFTALWVTVCSVYALTARAADPRREQVEQTVAAEMERYQVPGASVAVVEGYEIAWAAGYGNRSLEPREPVTAETLFQAASISKPVTAIAVLRLVEQGKLNLDEKVNERLKGWKIPENAVTQKTPIQLRHLLSHSAGLTVHGFPGYASDKTTPSLLEILNGQPPANTPAIRSFLRAGERFRYSGGGYCVIQQLLIETTGESFPQLMSDLVLKPADMQHSTFEQPLPAALASQAATGFRPKQVAIAGKWHTYPEMAPAGLWTTPSDLARVAIDVAKSYAGKDGKLLSKDMAHKMCTLENRVHGLGFALTGTGQSLCFQHGGANEGFRCVLMMHPATGQGIAVMTNSDHGGKLTDAVAKSAAEAYGWPKP